jgi:hypothetical protein
MKQFDIYITYVSWDGNGKSRPVLIIDQQDAVVSVFNITTQYDAIRAGYFTINDWKEAGLDRQSYVDTNTVRDVPAVVFMDKKEIGRLSVADEIRLIEFMSQ